MAQYGLENFVFGNVSGSFTTGQTTLNMATTHTARFTVFPMRAVLWKFATYTNPAEAFWDGFAEIIEIVSKSGDTFDVIKRGQEGIAAISSDGSEVYRLQPAPTRDQWLKTCRAPADGSGSFDAILQGTAGAVANALARFVKDDGINDAVVSLQGSPNEGDRTSLWLGDTATPDNVELELQKSGSATDRFTLLMNALPFLTIEGRNRMGLFVAGPGQPAGLHVGETIRSDKFVGMGEAGYTISSGEISDVNTPIVRISAEGGPGSDDLDTITLTDIPVGNRVILFLEPQTTAHDITITEAGNITLQSGPFVMSVDGDMIAVISNGVGNDEWVELFRIPAVPAISFVHIRDEKVITSDGGTFTSGAWRTRDLNVEASDDDGLASVSANQITLAAGIYVCYARAPAFEVRRHQTRLQNITDTSTELIGSSVYADDTTLTQNDSIVMGQFTISGTKVLELQHQAESTKGTTGFGQSADFTTEVFAEITFNKVGDA